MKYEIEIINEMRNEIKKDFNLSNKELKKMDKYVIERW